MAGEKKLTDPKLLLARLKQRNTRTSLPKRQQYVAQPDAVNQTLRVESKAPEQTHKKVQLHKEQNREKQRQHTREVIDKVKKPKLNNLEKADLQARQDAEHQQWVQDFGNGLVDYEGRPLDATYNGESVSPNNWQEALGYEDNIFRMPSSGEIQQRIDIQNKLFNLQQSNPTEYNRIILVANGVLDESKSMLMSPEQINEMYQIYNGRNQLDAERAARGWDHFETDQERQAKENAVRQNQINDNFFLNMYGSNPVSDEYAKQNPDIINYRFGQNGKVANWVTFAPLMGVGAGWLSGGSTAGTMFNLGQGIVPLDQVYGTFRRGFQNGGNDAIDAWTMGNSGLFNEDWANNHRGTMFAGNLGFDMLGGRVGNFAFSDPLNQWATIQNWRNFTKDPIYNIANNDIIINNAVKIPAVKRALEVAIRSTFGEGGGESLISDFKNRSLWSMRPQINYILFGKNNRWRRLFGQPEYNPADRAIDPKNMYTGIFGNERLDADFSGNDVIDSYIYGVPLDEQFGARLASDQSDYGIFTDYVRENYPGRRIQVYEFGDDPGDVSNIEFQSPLGEPEPTYTTHTGERITPFGDPEHKFQINVAGHQHLTGDSKSIGPVDQYWDIWKFNPFDYKKKWLKYFDPLNRWKYVGIKWLDKVGNPIIFKQNWIPQKPPKNPFAGTYIPGEPLPPLPDEITIDF